MQVGRIYQVPAIKHPSLEVYYPICGPRHTDSEFLFFNVPHYHYDVRFLDLNLTPDILDPPSALTLVHTGEGVPTLRPMKMLRETPVFPVEEAYWLSTLESAYAEVKFDCRTCPHRGIIIGDQPQHNNIVVCPGHGLRWNTLTGKLSARKQTT